MGRGFILLTSFYSNLIPQCLFLLKIAYYCANLMFHTSVYTTCMTINHGKELNEIINNKKPAVWFDLHRIDCRQKTKKTDRLLVMSHSYSTAVVSHQV